MKVSILIPVYNSAAFLAETVTSVLAQEWEDKEIIIVDDGSTDDSLVIARSFEYTDLVKVYSQPNQGACRARNLAFEKSSGDYIQYLDADDLLSASKIKSQMELAKQHGMNVVYTCAWERFYPGQEVDSIIPSAKFLDRDWEDPIEWLCHSWEGKGMGMMSAWLCHRKLIESAGPWDEQLLINQDGEFFCRVLLNAEGIKFCNEGLVLYRSGNPGSISQFKNLPVVSSQLLSYKLYQEHVLKREDSFRVRRALAHNYSSFLYSYFDAYPDLVREARNLLMQVGVKKAPLTGGRNFKFLAGVFGFENALRYRSTFRKINLWII
jgi:glycosyltransferase involved in cell wall biosynthesis